MMQQQSQLNKNDPGYMHIPADLPTVPMPQLNYKVQAALNRMKTYQS
jgi:hypothetical protein